MKKLYLALAMLILVSGLVGCEETDKNVIQGRAVEHDIEVIKIGFIGPLTGNTAEFGIAQKNALLMAQDRVNKEGGVDGKLVEVVFEDDKHLPKEAVTAVHKLIYYDKVKAIVGSMGSSPTIAIAPIVESEKIPLVSPVATGPAVRNAGDYVFRTMPNIIIQTKELADYLFFDKKRAKVGIFYVNNDFGKGAADEFEKFFIGVGGNVLVKEAHEAGAIDFRTELIKLKKADAIFLSSYPKETGLILRQAKELGFEMPLIGVETVGHKEVIAAAGEAAEGVVYAYPKQMTNDEFLRKYIERFGEEPRFGTDTAYDAFMLIVESMRQCGEEGERIKDCLYAVGQNYEGVSGVISFDEYGDVDKPVELFEIKDGVGVPLIIY